MASSTNCAVGTTCWVHRSVSLMCAMAFRADQMYPDALARCVVLPGQSFALQLVGQRFEVKTWILRHQHVAVVILNLDASICGRIAPPASRTVTGVVDGAAGLGSDGIQVIRKARAFQ